MADQNTAGFEIQVDIATLRKELQDATNQFQQFNQDAVKAASGVKTLETQSQSTATAIKTTTIASQALSAALGFLGAGSIQQVVYKLADLAKQAINLGIGFQGVQARAQAVFGDAFPNVIKQTDQMAQQFQRSSVEILQMRTDFALLLSSIGLTDEQTSTYSKTLSELAINIGKAFPGMDDATIFQTLESAIAGSSRALKQLDIPSSNKAFTDFGKSVGVNVSKLDAQGTSLLRLAFILQNSQKLQDAAAKSAGDMGDMAKEADSKWQTMMTNFGTTIGPTFEKGKLVVADWVTNFLTQLGVISKAIDGLWSKLGGLGGTIKSAAADSLPSALDSIIPGAGVVVKGAELIEQLGAASNSKNTVPFGPPGDPTQQLIQEAKNHVGGDPNGAKKAAEELKKAEDDYISSLKDEADANLNNLKIVRDDLLTRQKLGILTSAEETELGRINKLLVFKTDAINDAVQAWQDEATAVKDIQNKITDLNKQLADEQKNLADTFKQIDQDTARSKDDKVSELIKQKNDLLAKAQTEANGGLSGDDSKKLADINDQLGGFSAAQITEGTRLAGLTDSQSIDEDANRKRQDAIEKSDARQADIQAEIDGEQKKLIEAQTDEGLKKQAVIDSLKDRATATAAAYKDELAATKAHVDDMIAQLNRLGGTPAASTAQKHAAGGPVYGPGGPTDDRVSAWLSNGEYVINAMATRAYRPLIERINSMTLPVPRFAMGGPVTSTNHQNINVHQNNYGDAARFNSDPRQIRWHLRKYR